MQGRSRSRSQTSQVPFLSPQPPPHTPARRTLASLNTPSPRASNVNLLKIKGSLTDPAPTRRRCTLGQVSPLLSRFFSVSNRVGRPTCSISMRIVTSHIRPPSPTQNPWRFPYPSMTLLTILTYHSSIHTALTTQDSMLVTWNHWRRSYAAQSVAAWALP
jgi:hypothetical protein